jgi:hypothetical protein
VRTIQSISSSKQYDGLFAHNTFDEYHEIEVGSANMYLAIYKRDIT